MPEKNPKTYIATVVAIVFHAIGIIGILGYENDLVIKSTAINLLISFGLLLWTQKKKNTNFWIFLVSVCILGFIIEMVGIHTGEIFGTYTYGDSLGIKWKEVPLIIGINWFIIIYCTGISTQALLMRIMDKISGESAGPSKLMKTLTIIVDGATIATIFDWLMEPVAVKLNFWKWGDDGSIPYYNYLCWFIVSMLLLAIFHFCDFKKRNKFAVNLLLIQFMFFLILRTYLNN